MKILGSLISSHLPHLGLLFLMIVEAIVEAGLTERSKQGLFGNGTGGDNVGESLEDKLRQHLASTANTTRVRVALHHHTTHPPILPFSEILLNPAIQNRGQREFSIPGSLDESQLHFFSLDHEK